VAHGSRAARSADDADGDLLRLYLVALASRGLDTHGQLPSTAQPLAQGRQRELRVSLTDVSEFYSKGTRSVPSLFSLSLSLPYTTPPFFEILAYPPISCPHVPPSPTRCMILLRLHSHLFLSLLFWGPRAELVVGCVGEGMVSWELPETPRSHR
jgi:hypothetical protein